MCDLTESYHKQSKTSVPVSKIPQIAPGLCSTVKHCSSNDITVCHTFTLAIRFSLTLVTVSVMSPWYALTSAEMEVSQSNLTASSLCHSGVCVITQVLHECRQSQTSLFTSCCSSCRLFACSCPGRQIKTVFSCSYSHVK